MANTASTAITIFSLQLHRASSHLQSLRSLRSRQSLLSNSTGLRQIRHSISIVPVPNHAERRVAILQSVVAVEPGIQVTP